MGELRLDPQSVSGIKAGGAQTFTSAPSAVSANILDRATRLCKRSPQIVTRTPFRSLCGAIPLTALVACASIHGLGSDTFDSPLGPAPVVTRDLTGLPTNKEDDRYWQGRISECNQISDEGPRRDCKDKVDKERIRGLTPK